MEADGEDIEDMQDMWYLRRLDGGLFTLQTVDYILAWISMEDDGVRFLNEVRLWETHPSDLGTSTHTETA